MFKVILNAVFWLGYISFLLQCRVARLIIPWELVQVRISQSASTPSSWVFFFGIVVVVLLNMVLL